jgi:hypothetical protein
LGKLPGIVYLSYSYFISTKLLYLGDAHIAKKSFFGQKKDFQRSLDKDNMVPGAGISIISRF